MQPGEMVFIGLMCIGLPIAMVTYLASRWFRLKEKRIEADMMLAAEKAAQYVSGADRIEQRLAVLEQIVTDRGMETAAQIEALRTPRLTAVEQGR